MKIGTVVKCPDGSIGIIVSEGLLAYNVLFEDYFVRPMRKDKVINTGRYFDLSIMWDMAYGKSPTH